MRFEIPECRRCCFFVPLRYGIIIFAFLNMGFSIFLLSLESWLRLEDSLGYITMVTLRGLSMFAPVWFTLLLYILDVVFSLILLVGAIKKNTKVMSAYYYYGITTTLVVLVCYVVVSIQDGYLGSVYIHVLEAGFVFSGVALQAYLLVLIDSEIAKLRLQKHLRFSNNEEEVFCDAQEEGRFCS